MNRKCRQCGQSFELPEPSSVRAYCYGCSPKRKRGPRADKGVRKTKWVELTCPECEGVFEAPPWRVKRKTLTGRVFCSDECRVAHIKNGRMMREAVGPVGRPPQNNGEGARYISDQGYVIVHVPIDQRPPGCPRTMPEHRLVMAQHLGRYLERHETVHHINGDRQDNRLENLELWSKKHGSGQRVADQLAWAREILARYEPIADKL